MPAAPIPHYDAPPPDLAGLLTRFPGASALLWVRAARACRSQFYVERRRLTRGEVLPERIAGVEDRMTDLVLAEALLAEIAGAAAAAERQAVPDAPPPPFVTIGEAVERVVAEVAP